MGGKEISFALIGIVLGCLFVLVITNIDVILNLIILKWILKQLLNMWAK